MPFDRIFELIRKGEVVLFCGAGMSMYAGYPSGNDLAEMIYNSLTPGERNSISDNLTLPDLTEEFINVRLGKRNALHTILKEAFMKPPTSMFLHEILTEIPQIQTIITTNYDNLFELTYGNDCSVVKTNADITYLQKNKTAIIKIHGDLSLPDSILISKSDYTKFFDSQKEELLWTLVKERFATKNILFIGYNFDDINIESIFRKIGDQLGSNFKEVYLLAPHLKDVKIQTLNRKGIHYIDSTAEIFLKQLQQNIKDNVNDDFHKKYIDADCYRKILQKNKLNPSLKAIKDQYKLDNVSSIDKPLEAKVSFEVNRQNVELLERLEAFFKNEELTELTLDDTTVNKLNFQLNGITFPNREGEKLIFKPAPALTTTIDIHFNNGSEYEELPLEIYRIKQGLSFITHLKCGEFKIALDKVENVRSKNIAFTLNFKHVEGYQKVNEEIETHKFLKDFASSGGFTVFHPKIEKFSYGLEISPPLLKAAEKHLYYFNSLKRIEKFYNFKFGKIEAINKSTYDTLELLLSIVDDQLFEAEWKDSIPLTPTIAEKVPEFLNQITDESTIGYLSPTSETIQFHGKEINLGYRSIQVKHPYVANLEEIEKDPLNDIIIKSRTETILITYKPTR